MKALRAFNCPMQGTFCGEVGFVNEELIAPRQIRLAGT